MELKIVNEMADTSYQIVSGGEMYLITRNPRYNPVFFSKFIRWLAI